MENRREYRLPETLRHLMARHPHTGKKITQKALAEYLGVRPQTVSLYCTGESLPPGKICLGIADYFGVSADYLLVGYEDGDLYFSMMEAQERRLYERLGHIAVLCSQAENEALYIMGNEVDKNVQK